MHEMLHVLITKCTSDFFCMNEHMCAHAVLSKNVCKNIYVHICIKKTEICCCASLCNIKENIIDNNG